MKTRFESLFLYRHLTSFQMLSFQEQHILVNKIYDYSIDEDTIKTYINRGSTEERIYNKRYILSAFKNKLSLINFSDEYIKLVKLYISIFINNNEVYYFDERLEYKKEYAGGSYSKMTDTEGSFVKNIESIIEINCKDGIKLQISVDFIKNNKLKTTKLFCG